MWICDPKLYNKDPQPQPLQKAGCHPQLKLRLLCSAPRSRQGSVWKHMRGNGGLLTLGSECSAPSPCRLRPGAWPSSTLLFHAALLGQKEAFTPSTAWGQGVRGSTNHSNKTLDHCCRLLDALLPILPNIPRAVPPRDTEQPALATLM